VDANAAVGRDCRAELDHSGATAGKCGTDGRAEASRADDAARR